MEYKAALSEGMIYGPSVRNKMGLYWYKHTCMCRLRVTSTVSSAGPGINGFHSQLSSSSGLLMQALLISLMYCVKTVLSLLTQTFGQPMSNI